MGHNNRASNSQVAMSGIKVNPGDVKILHKCRTRRNALRLEESWSALYRSLGYKLLNKRIGSRQNGCSDRESNFKQNGKCARAVICLDTNTEYRSIAEAARSLSLTRSNLFIFLLSWKIKNYWRNVL